MLLEETLFIILIMVMIFLKNKTFYDTDFLSSFLRIDRMDLLLDNYGKILTSTQVKNEICDDRNYFKIKQGFLDLCDNDYVEIFEIEEGTEEWKTYFELSMASEDNGKDVGELSVIALSKAKNGILASNNLTDICECVERYGLDYITTATTLTKFFRNNLITLNDVKSYWRTMDQFGISLPKTSFENFCKLHGDPCGDFKSHKFN